MKKITIIALILLALISILIVPKELQNDTFYLIKAGESIINTGLDFIDHFSIHNLNYLYPHLLFSLITYFSYTILSYKGLYILTIVFTIILSFTLFFVNRKNSKNKLISLAISIITIIFLSSFITLRSQIFSYTIFILEYYFLNRLLETNKYKYYIYLILLPILLVNIHVAVYPFYIIMYFPIIGEYIYNKIFKKNNFNIKPIIISLLLAILSGLVSPLFIDSYTYLFYTLVNNTTAYIAEHQPTALITSPKMIILCILCIFLFTNKLFKLETKEKFLILGLIIMAFSSIRHQSLLIIFSMIITNKYIGNYLYEKEYKQNLDLEEKFITSKGMMFSILIILLMGTPMLIRNINMNYVNEKLYPVDTVKYIKKNLDYENIRIFNNIDIGSYLLLNDIKVFVDSRTDLYTKIYNKKEDIFLDYINVMQYKTYYEDIFEKYDIDYILQPNTNWLVTFLKHDDNYTIEYFDNYFTLFKRNTNLIKN